MKSAYKWTLILALVALVIWTLVMGAVWLLLRTGGPELAGYEVIAFYGWVVGVVVGAVSLPFIAWIVDLVGSLFQRPQQGEAQTACTNCGARRWQWSKSTGYTCDNCGLKYTGPPVEDV